MKTTEATHVTPASRIDWASWFSGMNPTMFIGAVIGKNTAVGAYWTIDDGGFGQIRIGIEVSHPDNFNVPFGSSTVRVRLSPEDLQQLELFAEKKIPILSLFDSEGDLKIDFSFTGNDLLITRWISWEGGEHPVNTEVNDVSFWDFQHKVAQSTARFVSLIPKD